MDGKGGGEGVVAGQVPLHGAQDQILESIRVDI